MPFYRVGKFMVHMKLSGPGSRRPPAPCCARMPRLSLMGEPTGTDVRCNAMSTALCDWAVDKGTCDAPLCAEHAHQVAGKNRHLCPIHFALQREQEPELF